MSATQPATVLSLTVLRASSTVAIECPVTRDVGERVQSARNSSVFSVPAGLDASGCVRVLQYPYSPSPSLSRFSHPQDLIGKVEGTVLDYNGDFSKLKPS